MGLIKTLRNIRNGVISAIPLLPNYTQTQYVDDNIPALESKNLNKAEKQLVTLTNQINANIGTLNTLITNSNVNIDKVQKLNSNGDFSQSLSMNNQKIYNLGTPTNSYDAVNKSYNDSNSFKKSGYNAGGSRITNVGTPSSNTDVANKQYVLDNATTGAIIGTQTFNYNSENITFRKGIKIFTRTSSYKWNVSQELINWMNTNNKDAFVELSITSVNVSNLDKAKSIGFSSSSTIKFIQSYVVYKPTSSGYSDSVQSGGTVPIIVRKTATTSSYFSISSDENSSSFKIYMKLINI